MTRSTILTTASGKHVDLLHPRPEDIDWDDVCEHLAKENRFNGATPGTAYSVAEHLCRGADAIFASTRDEPNLHAAYFLLHDVPEAYLKDDPTPKKKAIAALAEAEFGVLASAILGAIDALTERFDVAVHAAAGLDWPPPPEIASAVHHFDAIMLVTEWRDLKHCPMPFEPGEGIEPLAEHILTPWSHQRSRYELHHRLEFWLPALQRGRG